METDRALLAGLDKDPETGLAALMQCYTGLVWPVAAGYLENPEDVRECVNDTFAEFYRARARFDPEKGSLKLYLATIARRRAIDRLRASGRTEAVPLSEDIPTQEGISSEDRAALAAALDSLPEEDAAIIRMKYYDGMSFREIAASLNLPYETVKKRHQRSLGKMKKFLLAGLIVALTALLAACAYFVLRYFGLVPGYGVNTDPAGAIYVLEEPIAATNGDAEFQLEDAWWQDGNLTALVTAYGLQDTSKMPEVSLDGLDKLAPGGISHSLIPETGANRYRIVLRGQLPTDAGDTLKLSLTMSGAVFPITLTRAEETQLEEAGYYSLTEEGGLLAVPRLEDGELIVSIYPLNSGEFRIDPMLTQGAVADYGGPASPVTVTAPDGSVLEGTLEEYSYSLLDESGYLEWNFGPAQPGQYTLNVPYLFQYAAQGEDCAFSLDLTKPETCSLELPGGVLELDCPLPVEDPADYGLQLVQSQEFDHWWAVEGSWTGKDPERTPAYLYARSNGTGHTLEGGTSYPNITSQPWQDTQRDEETGREYALWKGFLLGVMEGLDTCEMTIPSDSICYRWEHPFAIPMTVEPEPQREEFTQVSGYYGLTAVPRREKDQVVLALYPQSTYEYVSVSPTIAHSPLAQAADLPITLTAQDGGVWEGTFRPSRGGTYSDWLFEDLPAGKYTLHVPYLYVTDNRSFHGAVPLPQQPGETLPVGQAQVNNGRILLGDITGLEPMTEFPYTYLDFTEAIGYPDGTIVTTYDLPLQAQLELTFPREEGEWMTLLDVGVQFGITSEGSQGNACQLSYTTDENGTHHSGLLLRYTPGLYAFDLTFTHPLFRLNESFDIPLRIPE